MKKTIIILAITILSFNTFSQTNAFPTSGDVGIGTTTPAGNLEIANPLGAVLSISTNGLNGSATSPLQPAVDFLGFLDGNKARITATEQTYNTYGSKLSFLVNDGSSATSLVERLTILQNGNIGIGTTTTGTHKLAVNGTVGAREIKVEATGWSDFVFEDNYELKDLEEVESYITENNHLPDVPSEKEVLKNGIQLGEMNAKLLQKIEELTLYAIEQNKKSENLINRVNKLETENEQLKGEINTIKNNITAY